MEQHELLLIAVAHTFMQLKTHNQRRKHRWWVHDIIKNRLQQWAYHNLVKDLQFEEEKFQQYFGLTREQCDQVLCYLEEYFAFWYSCLSERKPQLWRHIHGFPNFRHPISYLFPAWIATWNDSVCRIRSHSQPHDKSHAVSGHMEPPSSVYMLFHFGRITHNACRLRLPRKWNPSLTL